MVVEDLFVQFFGGGGGFGGMGGMFGGGMGQCGFFKVCIIYYIYKVFFEDIYCGKIFKLVFQCFIICFKCEGIGGKDGVVKKCFGCDGQGMKIMMC